MLLLSLTPHLCPLKHRRDVFGVRATRGALRFCTWICLFIYFLSKVPFPLHGYFWLLICPTNRVFLLKWLSHIPGRMWTSNTDFLSYLRRLQKVGALFCSGFNSSFRILKPMNSHVIFTLLYTTLLLLLLSCLPLSSNQLREIKKSAQVTTKYTFSKKLHT